MASKPCPKNCNGGSVRVKCGCCNGEGCAVCSGGYTWETCGECHGRGVVDD